MAETVQSHAQRGRQAAKIELFEFDASILDGEVWRFVNDSRPGGVSFGGFAYQSLPIKSEGWQRTGRGTLPRPTLTVSNLTGLFSYLNQLYGDLLGVGVRRIRTYAWALDGEPTADPDAILRPIDEFVISRLASQDDETVTYETAARIDLQGRVFPTRAMVQTFCSHIYRRFDSAKQEFDYRRATCPYSGAVYLTTSGRATNPAGDRCAKTVEACLARFGPGTDLGFAGFLGIDRVRL